ncbi:hypothetical protein MESS4_830302 [Mesorhizobium sp. STM 4661]|nr:hypothetical protein MESS4_830302 [Mesorhizobium sp. STM 4661]
MKLACRAASSLGIQHAWLMRLALCRAPVQRNCRLMRTAHRMNPFDHKRATELIGGRLNPPLTIPIYGSVSMARRRRASSGGDVQSPA